MLEQADPEELKPMESTHAGRVLEGLKPMERTHSGAAEKREEEGAAETNCNGLVRTATTSHSPASLGQGGVEEWGMKLSPEKREGWGEGIVLNCLCFSLSKPILTGIN